ncbi:MAG TPA: nitronate monooxygenase [Sediminibacterium sp.]|nr:nitronate monooxygenase [Sediminibacterium sp.]
MANNRITELLGIEYPIIQAGMVWASGWKLARAVSDAGGLGIIGAGSMHPETLQYHIRQLKTHCSKPFGVNLPLMYPEMQALIGILTEEKVPIVFTSAGNPATYTPYFKQQGMKVVHVVSSSRFAVKAAQAGCDAVVAEGFEAGGHNGREETTTMVLVPLVRAAVRIPVIAAGGIGTGRQMLAAMVLGADGVQVGSRFVCTEEASSHIAFKQAVVDAKEGDTLLSLKKLVPVRLLKNPFFQEVSEAEKKGADAEELKKILGHARAKKGMFEGDLVQGELEIGQVSALINDIKPAGEVLREIWEEYLATKESWKY